MGLVRGATAAVFRARNDERVSAVIAVNPWARTDATRSAALVQSHYGSRLRSPEFWKKLASGRRRDRRRSRSHRALPRREAR